MTVIVYMILECTKYCQYMPISNFVLWHLSRFSRLLSICRIIYRHNSRFLMKKQNNFVSSFYAEKL